MTSTDVSGTTSAEMPAPATAEENLEVVTLNVTDIDRAKGFYQSLGWRLDADFAIGDDFRIVQFTPPHSQCSIHFGKGLTTTGPGGPIRLILAVADIDAARADLVLAQQEYTRYTNLYKDEAVALKRSQEVTRSRDAAEAQQKLAAAKLAKAQADRTQIEVAEAPCTSSAAT